MSIGPIGPRLPDRPRIPLQEGGDQAPAGQLAGSLQGAGAAAQSFSDMFSGAIAQLDALQKTSDANVEKLASGQSIDLHEVMIGLEQASLGFQLAVQVRNRLIEAYQEVSRMQV